MEDIVGATLVVVGILFGVLVVGGLAANLLLLCFNRPNCLCCRCGRENCLCSDCLCQNCTCICACLRFQHGRDTSDYEEINGVKRGFVIIDIKKGFEMNKMNPTFCQNTCKICKGEIKISEDFHRASCRHEVHTDCLDRWLEKVNRCPLCNNRFQTTPVTAPPLSNSPLQIHDGI